MNTVEMNTVTAPVITPVMALLEQVKTLSFIELLALNTGLAAHIKSEFKKVAKKSKHVKNPDAPKRQLSTGMLAWKAFVKHLVATHPEMFVDAKATKKQEIASEYKKEHMEEYAAFVSAFVPPVVATVVTEDEGDCVVGQLEQTDKIAEVSMSNAAPDFVATTTSEKPKKKVKEPKPESEKKVSEKKVKEPKPESEKKKKEPKPDSEVVEEPKFKKIEIDGVTYWHITKTNEVYECLDDDGFGEEVGTYNAASNSITFA